MSYQSFTYCAKTEYIFTADAQNALKEALGRRKPKKLFVLASQRRFELVAEAVRELGIPYVLQTGCMPNPTADFINGCALCLREEQCDFLLGIGGGSVIDATKATAMLAANPTDGGIWDYISYTAMPQNPALPLGLVVTIPSTGSESNPSAVISNPKTLEKCIYSEDSLYPAFSIASPALTYTLPKDTTAAGVADILAHLLEQYLHGDTHVAVSDNMLLGIIKAVVHYGPISVQEPENYDARANLLWASYLAMSRLLGVGHSENWICHMVEHSLSARFALPHGVGMAVIMPAYMDMTGDPVGRLARLAEEVFEKPGEDASVLLRQFFRSLGLPGSLKETGVTLTDDVLAVCAQKSVPYGSMTVSGYPEFTEEQARDLLRLC